MRGLRSAMRGLRWDFASWRRREPVWCATVCAFGTFAAVQAILLLITGGDQSAAWLAIACLYGAYIGAKLEVSRIFTLAVRYRVAAELTVQDVRAQMGDYVAAVVEESYTAHLRRADALSERAR